MARRAKPANGDSNVTPIRGNGIEPKLMSSFMDRVLNLHGALDGERSDYMNACKSIRADMKEVYDEASDKGIPKRGFKAAVKKRLLEHKIEKIRDDMNGDDVDDYDMVLQALGGLADLPLGQAALAQHPHAPEGPQNVA